MIGLSLLGLVAVHELGHYLAARGLGYPARVGLRSATWGSADVRSTNRHRRDVAAAGPVANLLYAAVAAQSGNHRLALLSTIFAVVNLLPFRGSDGHHLLWPDRL